ncbi:MAG: hypothetical protein ACFFFH_13230 [Candidatus Thorarchaeota archaeon]
MVSIVLFGSLVNRHERVTTSTDVDLLVIIRDSCTSRDFQKLKRNLIHLENSLLPNSITNESVFIRSLQSATGMFCNFFICRISDFKRRNFNEVFSVNSFMGTFLAPQNSVWLSLLHHHRIIWGKNVFKEWQTFPRMTQYDLLRSFLMNMLLSTGALFLFPFYSPITKFSMEAVKWSLFTWKNIHHPEKTLNQIVTIYYKDASTIERCVLNNFMKFRKKMKTSNDFSLLACIFVLMLHLSLFRRSHG